MPSDKLPLNLSSGDLLLRLLSRSLECDLLLYLCRDPDRLRRKGDLRLPMGERDLRDNLLGDGDRRGLPLPMGDRLFLLPGGVLERRLMGERALMMGAGLLLFFLSSMVSGLLGLLIGGLLLFFIGVLLRTFSLSKERLF